MAITLYAHDTKYGVTTLTYNSSLGTFEGCVQASPSGQCAGVNFPSFALKYQLTQTNSLTMFWQGSAIFPYCPQSSTCGSSNFNTTDVAVWGSPSVVQCTPTYKLVFPFNTATYDGQTIGYSTTDTVTILTTP
jgi:hypothetical protein